MDTQIDKFVPHLLLHAMRRKRPIPYEVFHAAFPNMMALRERSAVLERVAASIGAPEVVDYACPLCKASGLPGLAFVHHFRRLHAQRFYAPLGADPSRAMRLAEKRRLTLESRHEVYRHCRTVRVRTSERSVVGKGNHAQCANGVLPLRLWLTVSAVLLTAGLVSGNAHAQEFSLFGGGSRAGSTNTYTWAINYQEGLGKYFAASFTWLNEGHIPNHHRDGQMIQLWARLPAASPQFVLQAGIGPYRYFDTTTALQGGSYSNVHGWGVVYSVRAAYYASNRWITQLQLNRVHVQRGPDSTGVMLGVGYQLDAPDTPGPRDWAASSSSRVTNNEVAVYLGKTIVNSTSSPGALGGAVEYRRGLAKYLDVTVGYMHEGSSKVSRRDGFTSQLWATRAFLNDKVTLGVGAGLYYAINENENSASPGPGAGKFSGLVTIASSYRFANHWDARLEWNRVVTRYNRDTDVILAGVGYRW